MKILILLLSFIWFSSGPAIKILIDISKTNSLNASEIAKELIPVPLKINDFKLIGLEKVYLVNEYIFILQRYQEEGVHYSNVFRFDLSGNYLGKLEAKNIGSKESLNIIDMHYNDSEKTVFLIYSNGYGIFNTEGKCISYTKQNWMNEATLIMTPTLFIFRGRIWFEEVFRNKDAFDLRLVNTNLNFNDKEIAKVFKTTASQFQGEVEWLHLSSNNGELFVSSQTDNIIYKLNDDVPIPAFEIEIKDGSSLKPDIKLNQKVIGKYIKSGYWSNFIEYDFLYNTENNKSFNIKYNRDRNKVYISGINDDFYNSGYFKFNITNGADYIYFIKSQEELKKSKLNAPEQKYPMLFLVKLK